MISSSAADSSPANPTLRSFLRPRSSAFALEPRVMFDAAAAVAADDHLTDNQATAKPSDTAGKASPPAVDSAPGSPSDAGPRNAPVGPITLLVVDSRIADYQSLLADLPGNVMVRVIDVGESGLDAITQAIEGASGSKAIESVQIVSHGSSGSLSLGRDTLDSATLASHSIQLQRWASQLSANADILLYGCDIAAGSRGSTLLTQLAALTSADIAASTDATGSAAKGGNWALEQQTGPIDSRLVLNAATLARYGSLLAAPVNTVPGAQAVAEDNTLVFDAGKIISVADADGTVQSVSVGVTHGTLTLASTTGLTLSGNGTASISITAGTITNINAALNGLVYRPGVNYAGPDTLTIVTNDGSSTDTDSVDIGVTPNAATPVLTLPTKSQTVAEDTPSALDFTGTNAITLTDADVNDLQTLTLSVTHGTLNISVSGGASIIGGNGTGSVILSGTAAQLSATLASVSGVQYTPGPNHNSTAGPEALSFDLNDGQHIQTGSVALNVTPVNDAPTISGGSPLSVAEGGTTGFSAALTVGSGFTQPQLGLVDVDTSAVQATIKIAGLPAHGTLKFNGNPVAIGSTLSVADIDKLSYTHDGSQVIGATSDTFLLTVDDGAGGLLTNQTVSVNLTPVNQPPSVSGTITVIEGETGVRLDLNGALPTLGSARGAISVSDPEGAAITTYHITSLPMHGTLFYNGVAITSASVGTPFVALDNTLLTYSHDGSETSADSFNISVTDNGGGTGIPATASGTINLAIYPNDDDPLLATNVTQTLATSSLTITPAMLQVTDIDTPNQAALTYTLNSVPDVALGYFTLNGKTLVAGTSFTQADIAAGLLVYVSRSNTPRTDSISFTAKDSDQRIYPTLRDGGIYNPGTDTLSVRTFNIDVPAIAPTDGNAPPPFALVNAAPVTGGSNGATLLEGATETITAAMLGATDADNTAVELVYRLHSLPTSGSVRLNGVPLVINQAFTQDDVDNGRVSFSHASGEDFVDAFTYTVSDGKSVSALQTFNIATTPQNDTPSATAAGQLVAEGGSFAVTATHIVLADRDNSASDNETGYAVNNLLSFLITGSVTSGTLKLNGVDVIANSTVVTAAQLAAGNLVYTHDRSETFADSFRLVPVDDQGITAGTATATNQISTGAEVSVPITIYPLNDAPSYFSKLDLTGVRAIQEGSTVSIGGASSYVTINGVTGSGVPTPVAGAHLVFGDDDNSSVQRQFRVTATTVNGQLMLNGATLGIGSVFTQADLDNGRITYKHNGTETSSDAFSYVVSDGDWTVNDSQIFPQGSTPIASTFLIEITPRNDVPTLAAPASLDAFAAGAGTTAITGVTLADLDLANGVTAGETDFVRIEVQVLDNAHALVGTALLSYGAADPFGGSAFLSGKNTNSLIVQGGKTQVDAILASLTLAFSADADASDYKIRITADDRLYSNAGVLTGGANGGPGPNNADGAAIDASNNRVTKDIVLRASNVNDVPTITNASAYSVNEDAQLTLGGFSVSDVDSFGEDVTVTVRLYSDAGRTTLANAGTQGALILGATTGLTTFSGNNSNTVTLTGSLAEVQDALNALKFAGAPNYNGSGVGNSDLYLRTTIADFAHADGQKTSVVDNTITIVPVNDQPTLSVPGNQTLSNGTSITIGGFVVGDAVDIGQGATDYVEVTLAATLLGVPHGTIALTAAGSATLTGNVTSSVVIKGSTADVQATLNSMIYTPVDANANNTIVITTSVDDRVGSVPGTGNGAEGSGVDGNNTNVKTFNINNSNSNEAPVVTAPATLTVNEDSTANAVAGISIADSDDFGAAEKVTLDLGASPKGTITLGTLTGLSFTTGDGTADSKMVFTGTKADINAALATLKFTPTGNINTVGGGNEQALSISVDDQGNTGVNGALTDSKTVLITITPVNDAPTRTAASTALAAVPEDSAAPAGNTVSSLFAGVFSDLTDTQMGGSIANPLAGVAIVGNATTAAQGKWQYDSGSGWTDLPTAPSLATPFLLKTTDQLRFLPTGNWNGTPGQLTGRLIDASSGAVTSGAGPDLSGAATGGTTAYSDAANAVTLSTSVTAVNDAPLASGTATLTAINEDRANPPGALVSALLTGANYSDATDTVAGGSSATALGGIAIVGNTANAVTQGAWQYSTNNGASWTAVPTGGLGDSSALVLPMAAKLRFVPVANYNGTPGGLSVRLADSVQVFGASADISPAIGSTGTWSAASIPVATTVNPINDAPTITGLNGALGLTLIEQQAAPIRLDADGNVNVFDQELNVSGNNWNLATLTVRRSGAAAASDVFSFVDDSPTVGIGVETAGANLVVDGITIGTFTNGGGSLVVTFNSSATAAQVAKAMGAVAYRNTSDAPPASVQINFILNDANSNVTGGGTAGGGQNQGGGGQLSTQSSVIVAINPVNDTPAIAGLDATRPGNYVENGTAIQIDSNAVLADPELDATNWSKATLSVTRSGGANAEDVFAATGTLSLTGAGSGNVLVSGVTVGTYTQTAGTIIVTFNTNATAARADSVMRGLTYRNTSDDPPASVTLTYTVNDQNPNVSGGGTAGTGVNQGNGGQLIATSNIIINITRINDAPVLSVAPPAASYTEQAAPVAVDAALNLSDVDDANMAAAIVTISPGSFVAGDALAVVTAGTSINANYNAATGVLTLTGTDSTAHYQQVLRSLTFSSTSDDPTINTTRPSRSLTYSVTDANSDGAGAQTTTSTRTVSISPVNDKPTLTGTSSTRSYIENAAAVTLEPALALADVDDTRIDQAVIHIGGGFVAGDRLNFTNQLGIGGSYNGLTGTLTLTGTTTLANYQAALRSINFDSSSDNPGSGTRTIAWTVRDVNSDAAANGQQTSLAGLTSINVTPVNDNPVALLDVNSIGKATVTPATGNVLVNDSDVDGGILRVTGLTSGTVGVPLVRSSGTLTVNADGTYSFTVNTADPAVAALGAGATLVETYNYSIADGQGGSATAQITIIINGANNPPVATDDTNSISEGTASVSAGASGVLVNDSDPNGDTLNVTGIATGANRPPASATPVPGGGTSATGTYGSLLLNPDGSYTYTLDNGKPAVNALAVGESLTDTFTYFISDGNGGTASANVVMTINGTNDGPDAVNDASSLPANSPGVTGNALGNDSDPDTSDRLTVSAVNGAPASVGLPVVGTYGSITVNANGSYTFTPNTTTAKALAAGQTATDGFTYTISDGHGGSDTATITISLAGVNDAPVARPDINTLTEDQASATGNVLTGARVTGSGTASTVGASADSDPDATDSLSVTGVLSSTGSVGALGSPLTGVFGAVTLNADGSYSYALDTARAAVQALKPGTIAHETYTYTISDGKGGTDTTTLDIEIVGLNDPPVVGDDHYDTVDTAGFPGGTPISGNVLINDSDPDAGDTLTVTAVTGTAAGTVGGGTLGTFGTLTLAADGTFTYNVDTSNPVVQSLLTGQSRTDTFTYTVSDGHGGFATATVTFTIHGTNDAPSALNDTNLISEDQPMASGNVISGSRVTGSGVVTNNDPGAQDTDPDGDPLTVTEIRHADPLLPAGAIGAPFAGDYGTLNLGAAGNYTYTLDNGNAAVQALKAGESHREIFVYTVNDGRGSFVDATITMVITGVNDAPVAVADTNSTTEDSGVAATGNVLPNDTDIDHGALLNVSGVVAGTAVSAPSGNLGGGVAGSFGTLTLGADGSYSYALDNTNPAVQALAAGATTTDTFTYAVTDDQGAISYTTLTITIHGLNDAPVAAPDVLAISTGNTQVSGDLTPGTPGQDVDVDGGTITVIGFANANGVFGSVGSGSTLAAALPGLYGSLQVAADGSHRYTLDNTNPDVLALKAGQSATETYTYIVSDGQGGYASSTLTISITGRNDPPVAVNDGVFVTNEDTPLNNMVVLTNDSDPDGDPLTVTGASSANGVVSINPDGTLNFVPAADFIGLATITYTISDGNGGTGTATVSISVSPVNDPPLATDDRGSTVNGRPLVIGVLGNDSDPDGDPLTITSIAGVPVIAGSTVTLPAGKVTLNADGTLGFVPNPGFNGDVLFPYEISDGNGGTSRATVSISISPVNDPPLATDDRGSTANGRPLVIRVLDNDSDPDGDPLTITSIAGVPVVAGSTVTLPAGKVTLNADGTLSFFPNPGFKGDVLFPYEISDGHGGTARANVGISVAAVAAAGDVFPTVPMPETPLWIAPPSEINPIPFAPAVFVIEVVQGFQGDRAATDPFAFSDPRAVRYGEIESQSIGAGLGFDPALFVQHAVRASQLEGAFLNNVVDGRTIRINLSSERLIPTPELALPNAGLFALQRPVADRGSEPGREVPALALARPPVAPGHLIAGREQPAPAHRAAPSFSEQLRRSAGRSSVAGRDTLHAIRARPHV